MGEYLLEMKKISKAFPGTQALDCVDLNIKAGEIHALLGENGAGKSTLMNVLTGQLLKDEGSIYMNGEILSINSPRDALQHNIVIVPQELNLIPDATVSENIFLGNERMKGHLVDWQKTTEEAEKLLKFFEFHIDPEVKVKNLSASYQQIVSIARALTYDPKILILDEPTAVLTNNEAKLLFAAMQRLKENGTAIIFITHHLDEVLSEAERMTIMRDGKVVKVETVAGKTKDDIIYYMAGRKVEKISRVSRKVSPEIFFEAKNLNRENEFQNINFSVRKGEILCVAGLVGAGRTEIFKTVFGITAKEPGGQFFVEGKPVEIDHPADAIDLGLGYVSEERRHDGITPLMSVLENMILPSYLKFIRKGLIDFESAGQLVDEYIQKFKIKTPTRDVLIKNLSGGNQQKVIVARWMAKNVKLLIMDEPTRGIDVNAKGEIHQLIRKLADSGVSVVVISSEMEEVLALADRIMVVHQGKIKGYIDDPTTANEEDVLKIAFRQ